jgi:methionyl-tRNA formyltransferase
MKINNAILLGTGKLAAQCAKAVLTFSIPAVVYDTNQTPSSLLRQSLSKSSVDYKFVNKPTITRDLVNIKENTLLASAINPYIVPKKVLEKPNLLAINCHYALLPKHPGRNAEAWAIYEEDQETGITWHRITSDIDSGDIISQKHFPINKTHTSLLLLRNLNQLAYQAFCELLPPLLDNTISSFPQDKQTKKQVHYSWEVPNDGYLDLNWPAGKISAFLRAMDYGIIELLGKPKLLLDDKCYNWASYQIKQINHTIEDDIQLSSSAIIITKENHQFVLNKYSLVDC